MVPCHHPPPPIPFCSTTDAMFHEDTVSCTRMRPTLIVEEKGQRGFPKSASSTNNNGTSPWRRRRRRSVRADLSPGIGPIAMETNSQPPPPYYYYSLHMHAHTCQLQARRCLNPDGGELHNSLICLWPLKECLKASPIPSGRHRKGQTGRGTPSAPRYYGHPPMSCPSPHI